MLRILRLLTPDEARQVASEAGARPGCMPEEIIRSLSRLCGATVWGIFPAGTDDVLLDHAGQRIGMPPLVRGPRAVAARERAVLAFYIRQAWQLLAPEDRRRLLDLALAAWDAPQLPLPEPPSGMEEEARAHLTLEALLQHAAGCRALAAAAGAVPLNLPVPAPPPGPIRIAGYPLGGGQMMWGHQALFQVLLHLWRARHRMMRERRVQREELDRQLRQLQSLLEVRHRDLVTRPARWSLNPVSGLSVSAGATVAAAASLALGGAAMPVAIVPAVVVGAAGLVWSTTAALLRPRPSADARVSRIQTQISQLRSHLNQVDRELFELETE